MPTAVYHPRVDIRTFDNSYREVPQADYNRHDVSSPFDAWSHVILRERCDLRRVRKVPTDLVLWGRGTGAQECTTRVGGLPAWMPGKPLPSKGNGGESGLRFFGQFNLADSKDILPPLPGYLVSVWAGEEFPWETSAIKTYWLDPSNASVPDDVAEDVIVPSLPKTPFFGTLYRTWDPDKDQDVELPSVRVDHQFESYRQYEPSGWAATKFGGVEAMPQGGSEPGDFQFLFQFQSIQPAHGVRFPWTNHETALDLGADENGIYHDSNGVILGDLGAIAFLLHAHGSLEGLFECG